MLHVGALKAVRELKTLCCSYCAFFRLDLAAAADCMGSNVDLMTPTMLKFVGTYANTLLEMRAMLDFCPMPELPEGTLQVLEVLEVQTPPCMNMSAPLGELLRGTKFTHLPRMPALVSLSIECCADVNEIPESRPLLESALCQPGLKRLVVSGFSRERLAPQRARTIKLPRMGRNLRHLVLDSTAFHTAAHIFAASKSLDSLETVGVTAAFHLVHPRICLAVCQVLRAMPALRKICVPFCEDIENCRAKLSRTVPGVPVEDCSDRELCEYV